MARLTSKLLLFVHWGFTLKLNTLFMQDTNALTWFCQLMYYIYHLHSSLNLTKPWFCRKNNLLKNAPHTAEVILSEEWDRPYTREEAAFPAPWVKTAKFWPTCSRVDNVYGDRNLVAKLTEDTPMAPAQEQREAATA